MAWTAPQYTRGQVDAAGREMLRPMSQMELGSWLRAMDVISNWRSSHSFPLNTFQNGLRKRGLRIDPTALIAQRIKRLASIDLKLRRFPGLRLSQIQDIGGCRIVLADVSLVTALVESYRASDVRHTLAKVDDYLSVPQPSGYRGVHLLYRYLSDKNQVYNGLRIELQIRSQLQHAWATAVETVGTFLQQSLKSSMGEEQWLRFFTLMGSAIALEEGTAPVPGTPADRRLLLDEINAIAGELDVINKLEVFGSALQFFEERPAAGDYFIITLDAAARRVVVTGFPRNRLQEAQSAYLQIEQSARDSGSDAVLVSVDSVAALQKAYPNYFLDTRVFIGVVRDALSRRPLIAETPVEITPSAPPRLTDLFD